MRISDWSSDVCSSDLRGEQRGASVHDHQVRTPAARRRAARRVGSVARRGGEPVSTSWKQPLTVPEVQDVTPALVHHGIVHVGIDPNGVPCVWFCAQADEPDTSNISAVSTGPTTVMKAVTRYTGSSAWPTP